MSNCDEQQDTSAMEHPAVSLSTLIIQRLSTWEQVRVISVPRAFIKLLLSAPRAGCGSSKEERALGWREKERAKSSVATHSSTLTDPFSLFALEVARGFCAN